MLPGICTACLRAVGGTDGGYGSLHDQATASTGAAGGRYCAGGGFGVTRVVVRVSCRHGDLAKTAAGHGDSAGVLRPWRWSSWSGQVWPGATL